MASLKALRLRIKSIKSTQRITKVMQMVAASKLKHTKETAEAAAPFCRIVLEAMNNLKSSNEGELTTFEKLFLHNGDVGTTLAIVITSERGLCGGFNQALLRFARQEIDQLKSQGIKVKIIAVGKKARELATTRYKEDIISLHQNLSINGASSIEPLSREILQLLQSGEFASCKLYYNSFKNAATQVPKCKQILPLDSVKHRRSSRFYESEGEGLATQVIKFYIAAEIYEAMLSSKAGEEAARMLAMDNATKNAMEMIEKLTLSLNRSRQSAITKELIEITAGAEAV